MVDETNVGGSQMRSGYYVLQTDGSMEASGHRSKGDPPGEAGIGVVLKDSNDVVVKSISRAIGPATKDVAEYEALIAGLEFAHDLGVTQIRVYMDSEFIVDQMNELSGVSEPNLKDPHDRALRLFRQFPNRRISWIPREWNKEADGLAKAARQPKRAPS
jgi:ribonuclease H / adenosylcobalamin/alpha-ribazole phosphatase